MGSRALEKELNLLTAIIEIKLDVDLVLWAKVKEVSHRSSLNDTCPAAPVSPDSGWPVSFLHPYPRPTEVLIETRKEGQLEVNTCQNRYDSIRSLDVL